MLESFVVKSIKDMLLIPPMIDRIEHELSELFNNGSESVETRIQVVNMRVKETEPKSIICFSSLKKRQTWIASPSGFLR